MDKNTTIEILEALASGCSPKTGEILPAESVLNEREVIRALQIAIETLKNDLGTKAVPKKPTVDKYKEIDYFKSEKFNQLSEIAIAQLKDKIVNLGLQKSENLSEHVIQARLQHPRAYEPWTSEEKELLMKAIAYTNDLALLSECFHRGEGSIETVGQKLIYEARQAEIS